MLNPAWLFYGAEHDESKYKDFIWIPLTQTIDQANRKIIGRISFFALEGLIFVVTSKTK
jgi:hypothetical protein